MKIITGDGGRDRGVCVWRGEGGWGVCLAFLHRTIRFRLILKRVNNSLGPVDKHWVRRRKGVACLAPMPTIPPQTIRFRLILKRVGRVGSHGCRHHYMQKSYHFLVDGEGQVDEMGLGPIVLRAGGCRVGHIDGTAATYR